MAPTGHVLGAQQLALHRGASVLSVARPGVRVIGTRKALLEQAERTGAIVLQPVRRRHRAVAVPGANPTTNTMPRQEKTWTRPSRRRQKRTTKPVCARTLRGRPREIGRIDLLGVSVRTVRPALIDMGSRWRYHHWTQNNEKTHMCLVVKYFRGPRPANSQSK